PHCEHDILVTKAALLHVPPSVAPLSPGRPPKSDAGALCGGVADSLAEAKAAFRAGASAIGGEERTRYPRLSQDPQPRFPLGGLIASDSKLCASSLTLLLPI